jgi:hypothetical protein
MLSVRPRGRVAHLRHQVWRALPHEQNRRNTFRRPCAVMAVEISSTPSSGSPFPPPREQLVCRSDRRRQRASDVRRAMRCAEGRGKHWPIRVALCRRCVGPRRTRRRARATLLTVLAAAAVLPARDAPARTLIISRASSVSHVAPPQHQRLAKPQPGERQRAHECAPLTGPCRHGVHFGESPVASLRLGTNPSFRSPQSTLRFRYDPGRGVG